MPIDYSGYNKWYKTLYKDCDEQYNSPNGYARCNLNIHCLYEECPIRIAEEKKIEYEKRKKEEKEIVVMDYLLHARLIT